MISLNILDVWQVNGMLRKELLLVDSASLPEAFVRPEDKIRRRDCGVYAIVTHGAPWHRGRNDRAATRDH